MTKHLVNDLLQEVIEERKCTFKSLSTHVWDVKISKRIFAYFQGMYIEDLTAKGLRDFFNSVRFKSNGELLSKNYLKAMKTLLVAVVKKAILEGYISMNPFDLGFKLPMGAESDPMERCISDKDLKKFLAAIQRNKRLKVMMTIMLLTGLRIGELLALCWSDIDWESRVLYIRRSVSKKYIEREGKLINLGPDFGQTKTVGSKRELPVEQMVLDLLEEWRTHVQSKPTLMNLIQQNGTENIVFVSYKGTIMNYNTIYKQLQAFLKQEKLEHCKILFHKMRHCYATHLVDAGTDINIVSKLLGHTNIMTTTKFYAKVNMQPKADAVKKHAKYMSKKYNIG